MAAEYDRRTLLKMAGVAFASKLLPGCGGESQNPPAPAPFTATALERKEIDLPNKQFLIVSRADGSDGHLLNHRIEAIVPDTGKVAATLGRGSAIAHIAPGGVFVGIVSKEEELYGGNVGVQPSVLRVFDTSKDLQTPILEREFTQDPKGRFNSRYAALDDTGSIYFANYRIAGLTKFTPGQSLAGDEHATPIPEFTPIQDPFITADGERGELAVAYQEGDGLAAFTCTLDTYSPTGHVSVSDQPRSLISMSWKGNVGAFTGLNRIDNAYQVVLAFRDTGLESQIFQSLYKPRFAAGGAIAADIVQPDSLELVSYGISVIDPRTFDEQRLTGYRDPQWLNDRTLLTRSVGDGHFHKVHIEDTGKLSAEPLTYSIPIVDTTVVRGMA